MNIYISVLEVCHHTKSAQVPVLDHRTYSTRMYSAVLNNKPLFWDYSVGITHFYFKTLLYYSYKSHVKFDCLAVSSQKCFIRFVVRPHYSIPKFVSLADIT